MGDGEKYLVNVLKGFYTSYLLVRKGTEGDGRKIFGKTDGSLFINGWFCHYCNT